MSNSDKPPYMVIIIVILILVVMTSAVVWRNIDVQNQENKLRSDITSWCEGMGYPSSELYIAYKPYHTSVAYCVKLENETGFKRREVCGSGEGYGWCKDE